MQPHQKKRTWVSTKPAFDRGFSLIEMMVAIAVLSIALATIYALFSNQVKASNTNREVVAMQQNVRAALNFMERDIRMAGFDPSGTSAAAILDAQSTQLQFQTDQDRDGTIAGAAETVTYDLNGGDLRRNGATLARNIDALNFVYLDADGNPTAQIPDIRSIQISIVGRSGAAVPAFFFRQQNNRNYANRSNDIILPAQIDDFRRMQATTEVDCRNLGI